MGAVRALGSECGRFADVATASLSLNQPIGSSRAQGMLSGFRISVIPLCEGNCRAEDSRFRGEVSVTQPSTRPAEEGDERVQLLADRIHTHRFSAHSLECAVRECVHASHRYFVREPPGLAWPPPSQPSCGCPGSAGCLPVAGSAPPWTQTSQPSRHWHIATWAPLAKENRHER